MIKHTKIIRMHRIRGSIMILLAPMMVVFFALSVLTIDLSHIFLVRNELQNAADAIALHSAAYFYPQASGGGPNWAEVQTRATEALTYNKVNGVALANVTTQVGYWDLTGASTTLKATTITPGANDVPAISITLSKSAGKNGGPISTYFGAIVGLSTVNLSANAIGVVAYPNTAPANTLFPVGMSQILYNTYWDSTLQQPKIDPSTGQPYIFQINEGPQGGWSTFKSQVNDTTSINSFISTGNPVNLSIGDSVWLPSGVKTAVYNNIPTNKDVAVVVVSASTPGSWQTVVGFGAMHIDFGVGGSGKYIQVHFSKDLKLPATILGGKNFGVYAPAKLVK